MPAAKIVNETEVKRWMEEGREYRWMVEEYRRKYNIETSISMWGNFRRRHGLELRIARDEELIPWKVNPEHDQRYPLSMLRFEARRRAGMDLADEHWAKLKSFLDKLTEGDLVVHYDPETEQGFFLVPRRVGVDKDLIREPVGKVRH